MVTMKSIKEKTEEYQETALKEKGAILRIDVRNAFKDGAYYVLDEIEKIIKYDKDPHVIEALKERIWRLKQ